MTYHVSWVPTAEDELIRIWLNEPDRTAITLAANEIDRRLHASPESEGESRPHGHRVTFVAPLAVTFEVRPQDRLVQVLDVWKVRRHDK
jgi:hypothetical protein